MPAPPVTSTDTDSDPFFAALDTVRCPSGHDDATRVVVTSPSAATAVHACGRCVGPVAAYFDGMFGGHEVVHTTNDAGE